MMHRSDLLTSRLDAMFGYPQTDGRPSWDVYFLQMAHHAASRATCPRAQVGCVLVRNRRILTTGYNGSPAGLPHCLEVGCMIIDGHCLRSIHAEQNAIIQAALHGVTTFGATCYATHYPCIHCAKILINAGIVRVVYNDEYKSAGSEFFSAAGVSVERIQL